MDPPQLDTQPVFSRRLRYVNTSGEQQISALRSGDLFNALGYVQEGLNIVPFAYTAKVKLIEIWATPKSDSDDSWQHASIDWHNSTSFASGKKVSDVSISNARPLHVISRPPRDSVCNFWMQAPGIEYCTLDIPRGAIVDIVVNFTLADSVTHATSISQVGTNQNVYYGRLDYFTGGYLKPTDLAFVP